MAAAITRQDLSAAGLRQAAARSRDANAARRMLAIALVLDGHARETSAETCGMDRQTLRDWVHRHNAEGIAGLENRHAPDPTPRLSAEQEAAVERWGEDGSELARAMWDHRYIWAYLFGAVCPERGVEAAVVLPYVDLEAMNIHVEPRGSPDLAEISRRVTEGAHAVLVLDGAGWHTSPRLRVPENISLLPLPRYAPELDPIENVWEFLC